MSDSRIPERDLGTSTGSPTDLVRVVKGGVSMVVPADSLPIPSAVQDELTTLKLGQGSLLVAFSTVSTMNADLAHPANTPAWVATGTDAEIGTYRKIGASGTGSWVKVPDRVSGLEGRTGTAEVKIEGLRDASEGQARRTLDRDGVAGFAFPLLASDAVVGFRDDGGLEAAYVGVPGIASTPSRDVPARVPIVSSSVDGRVAISVDPATGATDLILSAAAVADVAARIGTAQPALRGSWGSNVFNLRGGPDYDVAVVSDRGGRSFDARQLKAGTQNTLFMAPGLNAAPVELLLFMGQSNAGLGGGSPRLIDVSPWPHSTASFVGVNGSSYQGSVALNESVLTDITGALDYSTTPTAGINTAYGITERNSYMGRSDPGYLVATAWEGSQPITSFFPFATSGHYNYENAVAFATGAKRIAAMYGRTVECKALTFIQGEAGPTGRSAYGTLLDDLLDIVLPGIQAATGQASAPQCILWQTNMSKASSGENYASQGQWDVAESRADTVMAGPMYQFKLGVQGDGVTPETVHTSAEGRMMLGEAQADVDAALADDGDWKPVQPVSAVLSDSKITVTFGGTLLDRGLALAQDIDWVAAAANMGFSYTDDTSPPAIIGVAITGLRTVEITLASAPAGAGKTLRYAIDKFSDVDHWPFERGNLMVETERPSYSRRMGYAVPAFVRHYAIRFEIPVI